jgi:hypothetical protein
MCAFVDSLCGKWLYVDVVCYVAVCWCVVCGCMLMLCGMWLYVDVWYVAVCWCFVLCGCMLMLCGMWLYVDAVSLCVCPEFLSGWCLVMDPMNRHHPDNNSGHTHTYRRYRHRATYHTNNQRTHISGIGPGNCTKYGICAPWKWSNG